MTKLAKIMLIALTFSAFGIYLTSCRQSEILETATENTIEQTIQAPTNENGWLHFADGAAVDAAFTELIENFDEVDVWETKYNHSSLRASYETAVQEIDAAEEMGANFEQLIEKYKDVVQVIDEGGESQIVCIVDDIVTPALLNEQGIIQIGNRISKYSADKLKIITDGDASKVAMLDGIEQTNEALNIEVIDFNDNEAIENRGIQCLTSFENKDCTIIVEAKKRVRFRLSFYRNSGSRKLYMAHEMRGQRQRNNGNWRNSDITYGFKIESDFYVYDQGTALPTPPLVVDSGFTLDWQDNNSGRKTAIRYIMETGAFADLDIHFYNEYSARKTPSSEPKFCNMPGGSEHEKFIFECEEVWWHIGDD